ncbi:MAG TPA: type II toxin-antitoxin system VapC family toxin [Methylomirabilota bacterium]|nr:type II toxin-antitoxin system VapC family toxin [Methylomirabilota bacterium]
MSEFVVDASVAVKWFFREVHETDALRLIDGGHDLLVPDVFFAEFANALWKRVRGNQTTSAIAGAAVEELGRHFFQVHPSQALVPLALDLAMRFDRSVYDSLYLAVAVLRHCPVVTADRRFHDALAGGALRSHVLWIADVP